MQPLKQPPTQPPKSQQDFNAMYENLTPRQKEFLFPFLDGKTDQEIAEMMYGTTANVRRHLSNVFRVFGLSDSKGDRCRKELIELFLDYKSELVNNDLLATIGHQPKVQPWRGSAMVPDIPGRPMSLQSPFYIEPTFETRCCEEVLVSGQLIRIRAPQTTGKTSLLYRILNHAQQSNYHAIALNLRYDLDNSDVTNLATFLTWFCEAIAQRLELSFETVPNTKQGCTRYLQTQILPKLEQPLVLALDEAEVLFEYPDIAREFFALLRGWHEYAKTPGLEAIWEKLRLVVVHSTDDYIRLSTAQSPFQNVGYVVRLPQLQSNQIQRLADRYGLNWTVAEVDRLMQMVGGHPYLVQQALYSVSKRETTLDNLLTTAPTWAGIYRSHLLELSAKLHAVPQANLVEEALAQVLATEGNVRLKQEQAFQLEGLGLVQFSGNQVQISCELYRRFFQNELQAG